ncbi:MAG: DUF1104 domain-containing protein [Campylobacterota bacterium]
MKKILFALMLCMGVLYAEDYSQMSTQELIAIMGYVEENEQENFAKELASRIGQMSPDEKERYDQKRRELQEDK